MFDTLVVKTVKTTENKILHVEISLHCYDKSRGICERAPQSNTLPNTEKTAPKKRQKVNYCFNVGLAATGGIVHPFPRLLYFSLSIL